MRPIWAICAKSGQMCSRIGGGNPSLLTQMAPLMFSVSGWDSASWSWPSWHPHLRHLVLLPQRAEFCSCAGNMAQNRFTVDMFCSAVLDTEMVCLALLLSVDLAQYALDVGSCQSNLKIWGCGGGSPLLHRFRPKLVLLEYERPCSWAQQLHRCWADLWSASQNWRCSR